MSDDPRWLGPKREDIEDAVRALAVEAEHIQVFLRLAGGQDWRTFMALIEERRREVDRELARAESWEKTCRLQGQRRVYDWLLDFENQQQVAMENTIEELQGYQERLEGT